MLGNELKATWIFQLQAPPSWCLTPTLRKTHIPSCLIWPLWHITLYEKTWIAFPSILRFLGDLMKSIASVSLPSYQWEKPTPAYWLLNMTKDMCISYPAGCEWTGGMVNYAADCRSEEKLEQDFLFIYFYFICFTYILFSHSSSRSYPIYWGCIFENFIIQSFPFY